MTCSCPGHVSIVPLLLALSGCACGETGISGSPDAEDAVPDTSPDDGPDVDPSCRDDDEDGHRDQACGGTDCDDSDPTIHPGAPEVCLDGVDQDCDTVVDGLTRMGSATLVVEESLDPAHASLAWSGSEFGLVWEDYSPALNFTPVSALGLPAGEHRIVSAESPMPHTAHVAWTGSEYGITWSDWGTARPEIYFMRTDARGNRLIDNVRITDDPWISQNSRIAWTGSEFGLAWMDTRVGESECTMTSCLIDAFFTRISALGEKIGGDVRISDETIYSATPGNAWIFWTGGGFGAFWWAVLTSLDPDGVETGPDVHLDIDEFNQPVWTGSGYGALWNSHSSEAPGLHLSLHEPYGLLTDVIELLPTPNISEYSLAWTGSEYGAAYEMHGVPDPCVMFDVVRPDGTMPHATLDIADCDSYLVPAAITWTGSEFGLVWRHFMEGLYLDRIGFCD